MDSIPVIYEGGVFKPLVPVSLPEMIRVRVSIVEKVEELSDAEVIQRQKQAWAKLFAQLDSLPKHENDDGWSVANNVDELLYGGPNGPL
ncbi:MAG: antitoxin family protein [Lacipirellulaceae bacterium]